MCNPHDQEEDDEELTFEQALRSGDLVLSLPDGQCIRAHKAHLLLASPVIRDALRCQQPPSDGGATRPRPQGPPNALKRTRASSRQQRTQQAARAPSSKQLGTQPTAGAPSWAPSSQSGHPAGLQDTQQPAAAAAAVRLPVTGSWSGWMELLRHLYEHVLMDKASELTLEAAFQILPIAHAYNMGAILRRCVAKVQQVSDLGLPAAGSADGGHAEGPAAPQAPGLFHWLALGDAKQCEPLVQACLGQLGQQGAASAMRTAICSPHLAPYIDELRADTLKQLLRVALELPHDFKAVKVPELTKPPSFVKQVSGVRYSGSVGCLAGPLLIYVRDDACVLEAFNTTDGTTFQLAGHTKIVHAVAAGRPGSGGGRHLALSGSADSTVRLWDLSGRACCGMLDQHKAAVWSVCFCDQDRAASGAEGQILVWDLSTGTPISSLLSNASCATSLAASADGSMLLSAHYDDKELRLWDLRLQRCVRVLAGHSGMVRSAAMDAQGRLALSGSHDKTVRAWDLGSGQCTAVLHGHRSVVLDVQMDSAGTTAVSHGFKYGVRPEDSEICVWDLSRSALLVAHRWADVNDEVALHVAAAPDLSSVAVLSRAGNGVSSDRYNIRVW